ncbi:MAG: GIY-YIG nuclease family protein [Candidatus Thermoplasmatota archaeon]
MMKGTYILILELKKDSSITIGRLGVVNFTRGYYLYVGSGFNGLYKRIERHLRQDKKNHWHIDYLLRECSIIDVYYKESRVKEECFVAEMLKGLYEYIPGFGSSDCRCKSHLFKCNTINKNLLTMKLQMTEYKPIRKDL